jgi:hypothetical protein
MTRDDRFRKLYRIRNLRTADVVDRLVNAVGVAESLGVTSKDCGLGDCSTQWGDIVQPRNNREFMLVVTAERTLMQLPSFRHLLLNF